MARIYVSKLTIIGSENGLSPGRRQAIIWTNAGLLLIEPLGTNVSEILFETLTFSFKKIYLKPSSGKWRPFYLDLNVLMLNVQSIPIARIYTQQGSHRLYRIRLNLAQFSAQGLIYLEFA